MSHKTTKIIAVILLISALLLLGTTIYFAYQSNQNSKSDSKTADRVETENVGEDDQSEAEEEVVEDLPQEDTPDNTDEPETPSTDEITAINGSVTRKYIQAGEYLIDFKDGENVTTTYTVAPDAYVLLFDCSDTVAPEWHMYSFEQFAQISSRDLDLCFGEGANGYQIAVVNGKSVAFIKNGISVP